VRQHARHTFEIRLVEDLRARTLELALGPCGDDDGLCTAQSKGERNGLRASLAGALCAVHACACLPKTTAATGDQHVLSMNGALESDSRINLVYFSYVS
jgi:hypothetical protein